MDESKPPPALPPPPLPPTTDPWTVDEQQNDYYSHVPSSQYQQVSIYNLVLVGYRDYRKNYKAYSLDI
jgi:hypothetical protein